MSSPILQEASEWFVEFRDGAVDGARREAFNAWLRTSPQHIQAYLDVAAFWEDVPQLASGAGTTIDPAALIAAARQSNVHAWAPTASRPGKPRPRPAALAAACALVCLCAGLLVLWLFDSHYPTHRTAIGEQKSLTLADGSTVTLNSRSRIRVRFSAHERGIELIEGQALFSVAREAERPFIVRSGAARVRAVGTRFDVYRKEGGTRVTVIEGRVAINDTAAPLDAGEQVVVTAAAVRRARAPDVAAATAWTQRQLIFQSASLAEVVEEFNRYNHRQLVIEGGSLGGFHISAVFSSTDPLALVRFLRERFDVRVEETEDALRISR